MARKPRLHVAGGLYHVMLRGNSGQEIFSSKEDRGYFCEHLGEGVERFGHRIDPFCLMPNHVRLLVQVAEMPLTRIMQNVAFRHTRRVNRRQQRVGHLFQGRCKALLVDADAYLMELVRYLHLNPVRTRLGKMPEEYDWSGHRAYLGLDTVTRHETDWVLGEFARRRSTPRKRQGAFVAAGAREGHGDDLHRGVTDARSLAEDSLAEAVLGQSLSRRKPPTLEQIIEVTCQGYQVNVPDLSGPSRVRRLSEARGVVAWVAFTTKAATLLGVADRFHRDPTTFSRRVERIERQAKTARLLSRRLADLQTALTQA